MKVNEILELDLRIDGSKELLMKALKVIKPFSEIDGDVALEKIEKLLRLIQAKYQVEATIITYCRQEGYFSMPIEVKGQKVKYVYGLSIYELFSKAAIFLWSLLKSNKLRERCKD